MGFLLTFPLSMYPNKKLLDSVLQNRALLHVLFWLVGLLIAPFSSEQTIQELSATFIYRLVGMPIKIGATYLLAYYQIPKFFRMKKYGLFALSFLLSALVFTIIYRYNNIHLAEAWAGDSEEGESLLQIVKQIDFTFLVYFPRVYGYAIIFIFIKMIRGRSAEKKQLEALKKEKTDAELNFLKAQIHPHFLFNTLNNLYALTITKSDKAPSVVAKLSEILDYMLYQCKGDRVPVKKEIELLEHYIDLEKLRYGERLQHSFQATTDDPQTMIAPLILVSFVENAFKHGVSGATDQAIIEASLTIKENRLYFRVFNSKPVKAQTDERAYKDGIGLKNVQRQLDLTYPGLYKWQVEELKNSYEINLEIECL